MFVVVYKWRLRAGREAQFQKAWSELTRGLLSEQQTRGARLHEADDGTWIAYVQWESQKSWEDSPSLTKANVEAQRLMAESVESLETLFTMIIREDLLLPSVQ